LDIDNIEVARIREVLQRTPRFRERVFTSAERAYCDSRGAVAAQHYAARFAAKEATSKHCKRTGAIRSRTRLRRADPRYNA
jgi:holo-[acyl-carrier protein] synthase